jgi:hypothetical protein
MELPHGIPAWVIDSPINAPVVQRIWRERSAPSHLTGVTKFSSAGLDPEQALIEQLPTVDEHHGCYSADPPYTVVEVAGAPLTTRVREALAAYGFDNFEATPAGFRAFRPIPAGPSN